MIRNKIRTLAIFICLLLLFVLVAALSRFPVNENVLNAEGAAEWEKALYEAESRAYARGIPNEALFPALVFCTADGDGDRRPGYIRLFAEKEELLSSYAMAAESEAGNFVLSLLTISRKGRVNARTANPWNLGESGEWLLTPANAEGIEQLADDALPHLLLHLLKDGENLGWYDFRLYAPAEQMTD